MRPIPLLFLSDGITAGTGLARITRDIAVRTHEHCSDIFRVGTLGYGGPYSRAYQFPQYQLEMEDWVVTNLDEIWDDFADEENGIIFTIWDSSRLLWFSRPGSSPYPLHPRLKQMLSSGRFQRWGYFPLDARGPTESLTGILKYTLEGYNRILAYSEWARRIFSTTLGNSREVEQIPHGIDTSVFYPRQRINARHGFGMRLAAFDQKGRPVSIPDDRFLIGIVATNQNRKDWGLAAQVVSEFAKHRKIRLWTHVDKLEKHWSLPALFNDFGLVDDWIITNVPYSDEQMAWSYSACDVTLGIGNAEGFGFPIFESLACGTPVIHCNDGGAAEHLPEQMKVDPIYWKLEGLYNCRRGVYRVEDWLEKLLAIAGTKSQNSLLPPHLSWENNWPKWEEWLRKGIDETSQ